MEGSHFWKKLLNIRRGVKDDKMDLMWKAPISLKLMKTAGDGFFLSLDVMLVCKAGIPSKNRRFAL
uniref:Uncharacterized protein n=1 Tax=Oryza brachyantha TaxID=4533 RepID=J3NC68_ORYBR